MDQLVEKIKGELHGDSSSSDSDHEKSESSSSAIKAKIYHLFGREQPVHRVFGGGKGRVFVFF